MFPSALEEEVASSEPPRVPSDRHSERPTLRALPVMTPEAVGRPSVPSPLPTRPIELLSTSWLVEASEDAVPASSDLETTEWLGARPSDASSEATASTDRPTPSLVVGHARTRSHRRALRQAGLVAAACGVLVVGLAAVAWSGPPPRSTRALVEASREGHEARVVREADHVGLASGPIAAWDTAPPPAGACRLERGPVVVAARTRIGTTPSSLALAGGFVVAHAPSAGEVEAVRLDETTLGISERTRTREVGAANDEIARALLEVTGENAASVLARPAGRVRTMVWPEGGEPFAIELSGGAIATRRAWTAAPRPVWWLSRTAAVAPAAAPRRAFAVAPSTTARPAVVARPAASDGWLSAAARDDGGAVVALRYGGAVKVGAVDASFAPEGPLVSVTGPRPRASFGSSLPSIGVPAVVAHGTGAAVAWAEREEDGYRIHAATVARDGEVAVRDLGPGISPSLAELPDGDVLVVFATGEAGSRRVSVVRLAPDLAPRGTVLVVSRGGEDAGAPTVAVRADGRGIVTFDVADDAVVGRLLAAPITCDPGL